MELEEHYSQLLGINSPWEIYDVELKVDESRLDIWIEYMDDKGASPECGAACPRYDTRKERTWRHLDTMQFATYLHCNVPRVRCEKHDVKSIRVPWAEKNSRFTLLFEAFAIRVLNAARSVEEARKLLGLNWHQVDAIKARAVKRGLARRQATKIDCLGIDEKQFRRCQPWRAKRRLVDPSSREAALFSRRALRQRENKVGLRTRRPVIGSQVRSSNELAKLLRSAG